MRPDVRILCLTRQFATQTVENEVSERLSDFGKKENMVLSKYRSENVELERMHKKSGRCLHNHVETELLKNQVIHWQKTAFLR